jgi:hypothetical protein
MIMNKVEKKELSGFPNKVNLYDFSKLLRFADSDNEKVTIEPLFH